MAASEQIDAGCETPWAIVPYSGTTHSPRIHLPDPAPPHPQYPPMPSPAHPDTDPISAVFCSFPLLLRRTPSPSSPPPPLCSPAAASLSNSSPTSSTAPCSRRYDALVRSRTQCLTYELAVLVMRST